MLLLARLTSLSKARYKLLVDRGICYMSAPIIRQRATGAEQQQLRRQQLLDAAARALATSTIEDVSLSQIASAVGLTKPAIYRYWRNKELIFLDLYLREFDRLVVDFEADSIPEDSGDVEIADMFLSHALYCRLYVGVYPMLTQGLGIADSLAFNSRARDLTLRLNKVIAKWLDLDDLDEVAQLVRQIQQGLIGAWSMAQRDAEQEEVLARPDMYVLRVDLARDFRLIVSRLISAMPRA